MQCRITAAESVGLVSNSEEGMEPTGVSTNVGKEMDVAWRHCSRLHVDTLGRTGLGEGRRRRGNTLWEKRAVEGRNCDARKNSSRRRRFPRAAQKILTSARTRSVL